MVCPHYQVTYIGRVAEWGGTHCGLFWNSIYYNTFVVTTLEYVAQLEHIPEEATKAEEEAMRKLAPGPGNWIVLQDLENLHHLGFSSGFRLIGYTSYAAKLRLMGELGPNRIRSMNDQLLQEQSNSLARPFGTWHYTSFLSSSLCANEQYLRESSITFESIARKNKRDCKLTFQKQARLEIAAKLSSFDVENRIGHKIARCGLAGPLGIVARRCVRFCGLVRQNPPQQSALGIFVRFGMAGQRVPA